MATALVRIDGVAGSNTTLYPGQTVTFSNSNNTGVTTWKWELLDRPAASSASLTAAATPTTQLTLDKQGSYLVRLTVNEGLATADSNAVVAAIRQVRSRIRVPAAGETTEVDTNDGWAAARNRDLIKLDELLSGGSTQMGALINADSPPDGVSWKRGDLVAMETVLDINASAGDATIVPVWRKPESIPDPVVFGFIHSDLDGAATFTATGNLPGPGINIYHGVYVVINGFVKSSGAACLTFTDASKFPHGVSVGDPLYATRTSPNQLINFADHFGTETAFEGGSVSAHTAFPTAEARLIGYATQIDANGSVFISSAADRRMRTGPSRFTHGIVSHSIRLGGADAPTGDYGGLAPLNTYAGAIECDCFDITHGAPTNVAQFDMVSLIPSDTSSGNSRDGLLNAQLALATNPQKYAQLGMITDLGSAPNAGGTMKATVFGYVTGCAAAFPGGTVDGETLYLDPANPGKLERGDDLEDLATRPMVPAGRVIATGFLGGIFAVGQVGAPYNARDFTSYPPGYASGALYAYGGPNGVMIVSPGEFTDQQSGDFALAVDRNTYLDATASASKDAFTGTGTLTTSAGVQAITGTGTAFLTQFGTRTLTGTVASTGTAVTGTSTRFADQVGIGDLIGTAAKGYAKVASIESATALTLDAAIPGGNLAAGTTALLIEQPTIGLTTSSGQEYLPIVEITNNTSAKVFGAVAGNATTVAFTIGEPRCTASNAHLWVYLWVVGGTAETKAVLSTQRTSFHTGGLSGYTVGRVFGIVPLTSGGFEQFDARLNGTRVEVTGLVTQSQILTNGSATSYTALGWGGDSVPPYADKARMLAWVQYDGAGATSDAQLTLSTNNNTTHTVIKVTDVDGAAAGDKKRGSQDGIWMPANGFQGVTYYKLNSAEYDANIVINGFSFDRQLFVMW